MNAEIAELCGIILGDGNIHRSSNRVTITGGLADEIYHKRIVARLIKNNFDANPIFFKQEHKNAHYIQIESKPFLNYFLSIGLTRGPKINTVIPQIIKKEKRSIVPFLRGIFDTDGCLKFSKQAKKFSYYPRVRISAKDSPMARDIASLLKKLDFNYCLYMDKRAKNIIYNYEISGRKNILKWFNLIKPNNPNKVRRYIFWKENGYYENTNPKS